MKMQQFVRIEPVCVNGVCGFWQPAIITIVPDRDPDYGHEECELLGHDPTNAYGPARVEALDHARRLGLELVGD